MDKPKDKLYTPVDISDVGFEGRRGVRFSAEPPPPILS